MQNRTKIQHWRQLRNFNDFLKFWEPYLTTFGSILASRSQAKSELNFGLLFCSFPGFDGAATRASTPVPRGSFRRGCPQAAPSFARDDPITPHCRVAAVCRKRRCSVSQASQTRFHTPWARGPANFLVYFYGTFMFVEFSIVSINV